MNADRMKRFCLILFGPPGSGKGTQAKLLRQTLSWPHISTGDMLREHVQAGDEIGKAITELMQSGQLVSDALVDRLVEQRIERPDCKNGFILDGYPRTVPQAVVLEQLLDQRNFTPVVVYLKVDYNKVVARLAGRRLCPQCGALYSLGSSSPAISQVCDYDGATLIVRDDDREDVIRQRLETYERQTLPLIEHFREAGITLREVVATEGSPQVIVKKIVALIPAALESARGSAIGSAVE
jgi:adenylate kinase